MKDGMTKLTTKKHPRKPIKYWLALHNGAQVDYGEIAILRARYGESVTYKPKY